MEAILTYAALKAFVEAMLQAANWVRPAYDEHKSIDEDLFWFGALERSNESESLNRREMANLFLVGIPAMSEKNIEDWLDGFYCERGSLESDEDKQKYIKSTTDLLQAKLANLFGLITDETLNAAYEQWQTEQDELFGGAGD